MMFEYVEPRLKYIDSGKTEELVENPVPMPLSAANLTWTENGREPCHWYVRIC
jgi:hypothetical protein